METNQDSSETTTTKLSTADLNHALKQCSKWKPGCQFLLNSEKETLLCGTEDEQARIYKILETKMESIGSKLSELNKASFEVNEKGEIILSYSEPDTVQLLTSSSVDELKPFLRPIEIVPVSYGGTDGGGFGTSKYRAIIHKHNQGLISIVKDTYKPIANADIINPLMEQLDKLDNKWYIDPSHSFVTAERMRLQLTFPELNFNDGESDIPLSLFLHNSYDGTEGVRMMWGAIRGICSNGMVFGKVLSKFYGRHTKGFELGDLQEQLESTYKMIPSIQARVSELENQKTTRTFLSKIKTVYGERVSAYVKAVIASKGMKAVENQWKLYNVLTYYFSHAVQQKMRAQYQMKTASLFQL